jgi:hypothetical protein
VTSPLRETVKLMVEAPEWVKVNLTGEGRG